MRTHRQTTGQRVTNEQLRDLLRIRITAGRAVDALSLRKAGFACGSCRLSGLRREVQSQLRRVSVADAPPTAAASPAGDIRQTSVSTPQPAPQHARAKPFMLTLFKAFCRIMLEGMTSAVRRLRARAAHSTSRKQHSAEDLRNGTHSDTPLHDERMAARGMCVDQDLYRKRPSLLRGPR